MVSVVFVVVSSPKSQKRLEMVPVELSAKLTINGLAPLVGAPVKPATGTSAPTPVTGLVLAPSFPAVKITALLKAAALVGANRTTTLVEANPGRLNDEP